MQYLGTKNLEVLDGAECGKKKRGILLNCGGDSIEKFVKAVLIIFFGQFPELFPAGLLVSNYKSTIT